jgi:hypothetical protein
VIGTVVPMNRQLTRALGSAALAAAIAILPAAGARATTREDTLIGYLTDGDGLAAAQAITADGYQASATILGDAIFRAGIAAVDGGHTDAFAQAVAWALPHGRVSAVVANAAFVKAASTAATHGLTGGQVQAGAQAVTLTNEAYLGAGPKTWTGPSPRSRTHSATSGIN